LLGQLDQDELSLVKIYIEIEVWLNRILQGGILKNFKQLDYLPFSTEKNFPDRSTGGDLGYAIAEGMN